MQSNLVKTAANQTTVVQRPWPGRFHWWIDSVGGYLVFTQSRIRIGQVGGDRVDLAILADLSSCHAEIERCEGGLLLRAHAETFVNGKAGTGFLLRDGDHIRMRSVEMTYRQPIAWSTTARLEIHGKRRLPLSLDGIVLLGDACVVGGRKDAQIAAPWRQPVFVTWYQDKYWLRTQGTILIDGVEYAGWGPLQPNSQVQGDFGSFRWEPVRA